MRTQEPEGLTLGKGREKGRALLQGNTTLPEVLHNVAAAAAKSLQSCPTRCDPIDGSPPGSPVPGILQARTLQWVAISFSITVWTPIYFTSLMSFTSLPFMPATQSHLPFSKYAMPFHTLLLFT